MKKPTKNLLFNTKTRLKLTFCEKLRNNSLFGKKPNYSRLCLQSFAWVSTVCVSSSYHACPYKFGFPICSTRWCWILLILFYLELTWLEFQVSWDHIYCTFCPYTLFHEIGRLLFLHTKSFSIGHIGHLLQNHSPFLQLLEQSFLKPSLSSLGLHNIHKDIRSSGSCSLFSLILVVMKQIERNLQHNLVLLQILYTLLYRLATAS